MTPEVTVKGNPTPEELAAVLAVLLSSGTAAESAAPPTPSRWAERPARLRRALVPGPGAWRHAL